ncbi:MAG: STAS domain-containing protein [Neisseria sp.]|nr:STAS domain-containing protein [Neisseria sp.]
MNSELKNGTLYLSGDITVKTLNERNAAQCRALLGESVHTVDLGGVTRADSACLSLILSLKRQQGRLKTANLPAAVPALAELYEIREWLDR